MNPILNKVIESRGGNYCHIVEVEDVYELESIFESLADEFEDEYTNEEIQDFIDTLQIYCLNEKNEDEVYNYKFNY